MLWNFELLVLGSLVLVGAFCAFWIWLLSGIRRIGLQKEIGFLAINASIIASVYVGLRGDLLSTIIVFFTPPFAAYLGLSEVIEYREFLMPVLTKSALAGSVTFGIALLIPRLRKLSLSVGFVSLLAASIVIGEQHSTKKMCEAAVSMGVSEFRRNSFFWSIRNTPREFQFDIHAIVEKSGTRFGWSYGSLTFYEIPASAFGEVDGSIHRCK